MSIRDLQTDIESAFTTDTWTTLGITMVPANVSTPTGQEFVRLNVYTPSSLVDGFGEASDDGFITINIFTKSGQGERRSNEICDSLDLLFNGKTVGTTQFFKSSLIKTGEDSEDNSLWRVNYQVEFRRPTSL